MAGPTASLLALADGNPASLFTPLALGSTDPFGQVSHMAYLGDDNICAGIAQASGVFVVEDHPYIEMLVVHAGRVTLQDEHRVLELNPGDSAVIGSGRAICM